MLKSNALRAEDESPSLQATSHVNINFASERTHGQIGIHSTFVVRFLKILSYVKTLEQFADSNTNFLDTGSSLADAPCFVIIYFRDANEI